MECISASVVGESSVSTGGETPCSLDIQRLSFVCCILVATVGRIGAGRGISEIVLVQSSRYDLGELLPLET
jgi:hypothetical protein